jgi:hypothetical protein
VRCLDRSSNRRGNPEITTSSEWGGRTCDACTALTGLSKETTEPRSTAQEETVVARIALRTNQTEIRDTASYLRCAFPYTEDGMGTRGSLQPTTSESQAFVLRLYWFFTKFYGKLVAECSEGYGVQTVGCVSFSAK